MNDFDKKMAEVFDVVPTKVEEKKTNLPAITNAGEPDLKVDLEDAYAQSKDNLQEFIENGKEALEELFQIAKAGQHPRAFEVYAKLMDTLLSANEKLLDMQSKIQALSLLSNKDFLYKLKKKSL